MYALSQVHSPVSDRVNASTRIPAQNDGILAVVISPLYSYTYCDLILRDELSCNYPIYIIIRHVINGR